MGAASSSLTPAPGPSSGSIMFGIVMIGLALVILYNAISMANGKSSLFGNPSTAADHAPTPVNGKTKTTIPAGSLPSYGAEFGLQYWMYIADWDYKFGSVKSVVKRVSATDATIVNPEITLDPSENTLTFSVTTFGGKEQISVENVPLQSWFAVSVTVFQRNMDIYINGKLVKSKVFDAVPKLAIGDIVTGDAGGFSGSLCNIKLYPNALSTSDAASFFSAGTNCGSSAPSSAANTANAGSTFTIFGYTFTFGIKDASGKQVQTYTF